MSNETLDAVRNAIQAHYDAENPGDTNKRIVTYQIIAQVVDLDAPQDHDRELLYAAGEGSPSTRLGIVNLYQHHLLNGYGG